MLSVLVSGECLAPLPFHLFKNI